MTNSYFALGYRKARFVSALAAFPLVLAGYASRAQQPKELHIAAAADLQPVLPTLAAQYEAKTGVKIVASFGSSAMLAQQLSNGDPQDLFLSADLVHPKQLVAAGLTAGSAPTPYARGVLVLWARKDSVAQPISLEALTSAKVTKIAIANPLHAPYGLAATKALESLKLTETTKAKLVVAENIGQAAQFAESGNAQMGLISLTIASSPQFRTLGSFVRFPAGSYPEIEQCGVVMKGAKHKKEAEDFLKWLTSAEVQASLAKYGLDPVE